MRFRIPSFVAAVVALGLAGCGPSEPKIQASGPGVRLLTESQYRNIVADLFGPQIVVAGKFDPMLRTNGLAAVGAWNARITPNGMEQYEKMARAIGAQIVSPANRTAFVPCEPTSATEADDTCAKAFLERTGRMLLRHPMPADQLAGTVALAHEAATSFNSFYDGLGLGLASIMVSSPFLYVVDAVEPDPDHAGGVRLDSYAKASRLSFLLWNSAPDEALLIAAEKGELHSKSGLKRQVDRMLAAPQFETGLRAFFSDMLAFDNFENLEKDAIIYRAFSLAVANDAKEQALRTISNHLINEKGDYRDLFTTRNTFVSGALGKVYRIPVERPDGAWSRYEFAPDDPRAGLITQIAFAALYAHPGRSSPTMRGRAVRENLLCQKVPDPPGDVDFSLFNDPNSPNKTARQRLTAHATLAACAGCHRVTDPIGLALEKIDGAGQLRASENGEAIDTSGDLDGIKYADAVGLGKALHDNANTPSCVVRRLYAYGTGRDGVGDQKELMKFYEEKFAAAGYRVPDLLRAIAESDAFFAVTKSKSAATTAWGEPLSHSTPAQENKS